MADTEHSDSDDALETAQQTAAGEGDAELEAGEEAQAERLQLQVTIDSRSACERHISVTVPRDDIERYYDKEFTELMPSAQVPGFRPGHVPRKLLEKRFRKDVTEKVKTALLMDSLAQISEEEELSAISEPEIDLEAVEMPDDGPLTFEFDLEVRPEFELPRWKGLSLQKPVREFSDEDIDRALESVLVDRGRLVPCDVPAEPGDYVTVNLTSKHGEEVVSTITEQVIRIRPVLSFRDCEIENLDELLRGVSAGETRAAEAELTEDAPNVALRGQRITVEFQVLEVKKLQLPELDAALLDELGGFELEADLRDAVKDQLQRQLQYEQHRRAREQITAALTVAADWELPPELLERQSHRELERAVMELRRSGFNDDEIRAHENRLRQNSRSATARALKEHFILERIAEEEQTEVAEEDYEREIRLIAAQSHESPRRVRARLEKGGSMDVLRNQIVERKVIDLILEHAQFKEVPYELGRTDTEAIDRAAGGRQSDIPEAKPERLEAAPGGRPEEPPVRE
jgi:trigger factor